MPDLVAAEIHEALASSEFFFAYQPVVDLTLGEISSLEALIRWDHPRLGTLGPISFLPLLHAAALSDELTAWEIRQVAHDLEQLQKTYGPDVRVSINLSRDQLLQPERAINLVLLGMAANDMDPNALSIEIVEDLTGVDIRRSAKAFERLRSMGVRVVLDDFGTGASSLSALTDVPYDGLKIDRRFVNNIATDPNAHSVIEAIIAFGRATGTDIIAEGIESAHQRAMLIEVGCELGQGYLFARPQRPTSDPVQTESSDPTTSPALNAKLISQVPSPSPQTDDLASMSAQLQRINVHPTVAVDSFEEAYERLLHLDDLARSFGQDGQTHRCNIGIRLVVLAKYANRYSLAMEWAVQTKQLADRIGHASLGVLTLAHMASTHSNHQDGVNMQVAALLEAIEVRSSRPMDLSLLPAIDQSVAWSFEQLGLLDDACWWYLDSFRTHRETHAAACAIGALNLADIQLSALEGTVTLTQGWLAEEATSLVEEIIDYRHQNPFADRDVTDSLLSRLLVANGELEQARRALPEPAESDDLIVMAMCARAQAMLARSSGDNEAFLDAATDMAMLLDPQRVALCRQRASAKSLHAQALKANGHIDEYVAAIERLTAAEHVFALRVMSALASHIQTHTNMG